MSKVHHEHSTKFRGKDQPGEDNPAKQESRFVRCKFCRSINDTLKRSKGDGWGGNFTKTDTGATATTLKYDVVSGAGCWFCGASEYY